MCDDCQLTVPSIHGDSFQAPQHPRKPMMVTYIAVGFVNPHENSSFCNALSNVHVDTYNFSCKRNTGDDYQRANAKYDVGAQVVIRSLV